MGAVRGPDGPERAGIVGSTYRSHRPALAAHGQYTRCVTSVARLAYPVLILLADNDGTHPWVCGVPRPHAVDPDEARTQASP
jgi:hypothetical protein